MNEKDATITLYLSTILSLFAFSLIRACCLPLRDEWGTEKPHTVIERTVELGFVP